MKSFHAYIVSMDGAVKYVGITTRGVAKRWTEHKRSKACRLLFRAMAKYGAESFVIEHVASAWDKESLLDLEAILARQWGTLAPDGYNLKAGGSQNLIISDETRARMRASNVGRIQTGQKREKNRIASTGRQDTPETRAKKSTSRIGIKFSPSHLANMSRVQLGHCHSDATRAKMSATRTGRKHTAEWKEKQRISAIRRGISQETRARMKLAYQGRRTRNKLTNKGQST